MLCCFEQNTTLVGIGYVGSWTLETVRTINVVVSFSLKRLRIRYFLEGLNQRHRTCWLYWIELIEFCFIFLLISVDYSPDYIRKTTKIRDNFNRLTIYWEPTCASVVMFETRGNGYKPKSCNWKVNNFYSESICCQIILLVTIGFSDFFIIKKIQ